MTVEESSVRGVAKQIGDRREGECSFWHGGDSYPGVGIRFGPDASAPRTFTNRRGMSSGGWREGKGLTGVRG